MEFFNLIKKNLHYLNKISLTFSKNKENNHVLWQGKEMALITIETRLFCLFE